MRRFHIFFLLGLVIIGLVFIPFPAMAQENPERYNNGAFSFDYPWNWFTDETRPGVIMVANSFSAISGASSGDMDEGEVVVQIISPEVVDSFIASQDMALENPEDILKTASETNQNFDFNKIVSTTFNGAPAAKVSYTTSGMAITSYVFSLQNGHFVVMDLITARSENARYVSIALGIAATMRYGQPLLYSFSEHIMPVDVLSFSSDGTTLVSGGIDGVFLWDIATGSKQTELTLPHELGLIRDLDVMPDGTILVAGDDNEHLRVWNATNGRILQEFAYPPGSIFTLGSVFSPSGTQIASVTAAEADTSYLTVWDLTTGEIVHQTEVVSIIQEPLTYVSYSPDGTLIATSGRSYPVYLHDAATGEVIREIGHPLIEAGIRGSPVFSPDGTLLGVGGFSTLWPILVWDTTSGEMVEQLDADDIGMPVVAFSPDGRLLASGGADQKVRVWNVATEAELVALTGHEAEIRSLVFSPDGTILVSGDRSGVIKVWDLKTALPEFVFSRP